MFTQTFTLTLGECSENHVGMQQLGNIGRNGFLYEDLQDWKNKFEKLGATCDLLDLNKEGNMTIDEKAYILIIRKGLTYILNDKTADKLFEEQDKLEKDTKAFMRGRIVNKRARYNLCFDEKGQEPDYENKKGRIISYKDVPLLYKIRKLLPKFTNEKTKNLYVEANYYYDINKCGIGFHGDSERKKVVAIRLGLEMPLHFQWYCNSKPEGNRIKIILYHGDIYFMSEKATGYDWKKRKIYTLRHAAGCKKYLKE